MWHRQNCASLDPDSAWWNDTSTIGCRGYRMLENARETSFEPAKTDNLHLSPFTPKQIEAELKKSTFHLWGLVRLHKAAAIVDVIQMRVRSEYLTLVVGWLSRCPVQILARVFVTILVMVKSWLIQVPQTVPLIIAFQGSFLVVLHHMSATGTRSFHGIICTVADQDRPAVHDHHSRVPWIYCGYLQNVWLQIRWMRTCYAFCKI